MVSTHPALSLMWYSTEATSVLSGPPFCKSFECMSHSSVPFHKSFECLFIFSQSSQFEYVYLLANQDLNEQGCKKILKFRTSVDVRMARRSSRLQFEYHTRSCVATKERLYILHSKYLDRPCMLEIFVILVFMEWKYRF